MCHRRNCIGHWHLYPNKQMLQNWKPELPETARFSFYWETNCQWAQTKNFQQIQRSLMVYPAPEKSIHTNWRLSSCVHVLPVAHTGLCLTSLPLNPNMRTIKHLRAPPIDCTKKIFQWDKSYATLLKTAGLERIQERRQRLTDKFILKTPADPRYQEKWFLLKEFVHHDLRREKYYMEEFAKTDRLYNAPIFYYRRRLNEIAQTDLNRLKEPGNLWQFWH